jgi:aminoglycoside phosphotransferase family enzyme
VKRVVRFGADNPIDWLVSMRQFPAARMLDYGIAHGIVQEADVC